MIANTSSLAAPPTRTTTLAKAIVITLGAESAFTAAKAAATLARSEFVEPASQTLAALQLFLCGLLSVWTYRACRRAQTRGIEDMQPLWAAGAWFIPGFQLFVPYVFVRRAARPSARTSPVTRWQIASFVAFTVAWVGGRFSPGTRAATLAVGAFSGAVAAAYAWRSMVTVERTSADAGC